MDKRLAEARTAFLAAGSALVICAATIAGLSSQPHITEQGWWRGLLALGLFGMLVSGYGYLAMIFPGIGPRPQMLRERLLWTAKRYRLFAQRNEAHSGSLFLIRFRNKHSYEDMMALANRANNVLGPGTRINWKLLTEYTVDCDIIRQIADHLEALAKDVPPNIPL